MLQSRTTSLKKRHVQAADITSDQLTMRIDNEVEESYTPVIQKTLEAKAVEVNGTC